jgi:hypothetical protein
MSTAAGTEAAGAAASGSEQDSGAGGGGTSPQEQSGSTGSGTTDPTASELARARSDAARYRQERNQLREEKTASERAKMDDKTRAESERDEWKTKFTSLEGTSLRLEVALAAAPDTMKPKDVARLAKRLTGTSREELEADAKELFEEFGGMSTTSTGKAPVSGRPQSRLRAGANNDEDDADQGDVDIDKIPRM